MRCLCFCMFFLAFAIVTIEARATTLATATYDTDSYIFVGTNSEFDPGVTNTEDFTGGTVESDNTHIVFGVVKFEDLTALDTKANGGGDKFLKLTVGALPGDSTVAISAAKEDIESDTNGYPSGFFSGNPAGNENDRLQWYMDNVKGDDATYGGYDGGAAHLGAFDVTAFGDIYLDVTATVDGWIDGSAANHGFGLWGINVPGGLGNTLDFVSSDNPAGGGPELVSQIPEPSAITLSVLAIAGLGFRRKRLGTL